MRRGAWRSPRVLAVVAAAAALSAAAVALVAAGSGSKPFAAYRSLPSLSLRGSGASGGTGRACGTAVDSHGEVFVADPERRRIEVFGPQREYLGEVPDRHGACQLAVDSKGALYALEADGRVVKYLPTSYPFDGSAVYGAAKTIDAGGRAKGIAVDPYDDRLFVAEGDRVSVYKPNGVLGQNEVQRVLPMNFRGGTFRLSFEGQTTRPIPYDASQGEVRSALASLPAIGPGNVVVREGIDGPEDHFITFTGALGAKEVPRLTADTRGLRGRAQGSFILERLVRAFGGQIGEGRLHDAVGVAAYTYDGSHSGVGGLLAESPGLVSGGSEGYEERLVGLGGGGPPQGAAERLVNHKPRVYGGYRRFVFVADSGASADSVLVLAGDDVRRLSPLARIDGSKTPAGGIGFGEGAASMAADPVDGHLFLRDAAHAAIEELEASGSYVAQIADPAFGGAGAMGIAVAGPGSPAPGRVYVADGASEVAAFAPLRARGHAPVPGFGVKLPEACGVAVDSHGDVYASGEGEIRVLDPAGKQLGRVRDPGGPCQLAVDSAGDLYAVDAGVGPHGEGAVVVYEAKSYPPSGSVELAKPKTIAWIREWEARLAIDPADDHLFAALGEHRIAEYGSASEGSPLIRDDFGASLPGGIDTYNGGLDVCGASGDVYAAGRATGGWSVYVLDPTGTRLLTRIDGSGSPHGPFTTHGVSLALDQSDCHLFVTLEERRVEEYEPTGAFVSEFGPELLFFGGDIAVDNGAESPNRGDVYAANYAGISAFGPLDYRR
jgi:DNA-binding beta-propeller fold protein YncE